MSTLSLFAWGANNYGQLANGEPCEQLERPILVQAPMLDHDTGIVLGGGHTFLVSGSGQFFASGWNHKGQCGVGSKTNLDKFTPIPDIRASQVAAGWDFTLVVNTHGRLFGCGSNAFGQLGMSNVKEVSKFQEIQVGNDQVQVKKVAAGMRHSLILLQDGTLWVCGSGKKGQLCDHTKNISEPRKVDLKKNVIDVQAGQNFSLITFEDKSFQAFGDDKHKQITNLKSIETHEVEDIKLGWTHIVILCKDKTMKAVGRDDYGQTAVVSNEKFTKASSGYEHGLAINEEGHLFSWGWNEHGNCGLGHVNNVQTPTKIDLPLKVKSCFAGSGHSFAIVIS